MRIFFGSARRIYVHDTIVRWSENNYFILQKTPTN